MQFKVSSSLLSKNLSQIVSVIAAHPVLPILETFKFALAPGHLTITATNLEATIKKHLPVDSEDAISLCVPSKILTDSLKNLPEQLLVFQIDPETLVVSVSYTMGRFEIPAESDATFPAEVSKEHLTSVVLPGNTLLDGINYTLFAANQDELRPVLGGVFFDFQPESGFSFVASNGNRLAHFKYDKKMPENTIKSVAPRKSLGILKGMLRDDDTPVHIKVTDSHIFFEYQPQEDSHDSFEMSCRLIEGNFPDWRSVLPKDSPVVAMLSKSDLLQTLRRTINFTEKASLLVKFVFNNQKQALNVSSEDKNFGYKSKEELSCAYRGAVDLVLGFNAKLLMEMLSVCPDEQVQLLMSHAMKGVLVCPEKMEEGRHLVMLIMPLLLPDQE